MKINILVNLLKLYSFLLLLLLLLFISLGGLRWRLESIVTMVVVHSCAFAMMINCHLSGCCYPINDVDDGGGATVEKQPVTMSLQSVHTLTLFSLGSPVNRGRVSLLEWTREGGLETLVFN